MNLLSIASGLNLHQEPDRIHEDEDDEEDDEDDEFEAAISTGVEGCFNDSHQVDSFVNTMATLTV